MDLNKEKKYIQQIDKKVRELELEKAKLEQQKIFAQNGVQDSLKKMEELGYTPDNIHEGIKSLYDNIEKLKSKINVSLGIEVEDNDDDDLPF